MSKTRKGLSLVELMVVLIIVTIITLGFGTSALKQVKRTNRETVVNEMQVLASNLSDAYYDLGNPVFDPSETDAEANFRTFLNTVSSEYINYTFDYSTLTPTTGNTGYYIRVSDPVDTWEQDYNCWFETNRVTVAGTANRYVMVVSGGDDGIVGKGVSADSVIPDISDYINSKYGDDIVLLVKPKALS